MIVFSTEGAMDADGPEYDVKLLRPRKVSKLPVPSIAENAFKSIDPRIKVVAHLLGNRATVVFHVWGP